MKIKALIYIIAACVLWGTSAIFVHYLTPYGYTSFQMSAVRGVISLVCMAAFALIKDVHLFKIRLKELLLFACIGATLFGTGSFYYLSMQLTSPSTAVVLMYTAPVYVMIFSVLFFGEKLSPLKLFASITILIGCFLVSGIIGGLKFDALGIAVGALSGISYAAYNILTKLAMRNGSKPVSTTLYGFLFMSLIALCVSQPQAIIPQITPAPQVIIPLLIGLGIATFVLPYVLYTLAMKELSAGCASALGIIEPMATTVFSVFLLKNEKLTPLSVLGIVLILISVLLLGITETANKAPVSNEPAPSDENNSSL